MKTYDEALNAAADKPAFSNGTEGHAWTGRWCDRCIHDRSARVDSVKPDPRNNGLLGCALLAVAIMGKTPAEWAENEPKFQLGNTYTCSEFEEDRPGGGEPKRPPTPRPECDGQLDIVDAYLDTAISELTPKPVEVAS
jgi:hypothetical protein